MIQLNQQKTQQLEHSRAQAVNLSTQSLFFSFFFFSLGHYLFAQERHPWHGVRTSGQLGQAPWQAVLSLATLALGGSGNDSFQFQSHVVSHLDPTSSL